MDIRGENRNDTDNNTPPQPPAVLEYIQWDFRLPTPTPRGHIHTLNIDVNRHWIVDTTRPDFTDPLSHEQIEDIAQECINQDPQARTVFTYGIASPTAPLVKEVIKVGTHVRRSEVENLEILENRDFPVPVAFRFSPVRSTPQKQY